MSVLGLERSRVTDGTSSLLAASEALPEAIQLLATGFVSLHAVSSRIAELFATQQRWLLSHMAVAVHYRAANGGGPQLTRRNFCHLALQHGLVSRNTALAFFDEALHYGVVSLVDPAGEGRVDPVAPSPAAIALLTHWYSVHFQAYDLLDGGDRATRFAARAEQILPVIQPIVADALLSSAEVRVPGPFYAIFTWADVGGLLMDRLIAGIDWASSAGEERLLTDVSAITYLAEAFGLSRAHTSRKLSEAASIGGVGWSGRAGRSRLWVSRDFYNEYVDAQLRKLIFLDQALARTSSALRTR